MNNDISNSPTESSGGPVGSTSRPRPRQARYWIATVPRDDWTPCLPESAAWITGQLERGDSTGYEHWQFVVSYSSKKSLNFLRRSISARGHFEPTRSSAAVEYVNKEDTRIGDPFEFGSRAISRNSKTDWDRVRLLASSGSFEEIPSDIFIRYYNNLKKIAADYVQPVAIERSTKVNITYLLQIVK